MQARAHLYAPSGSNGTRRYLVQATAAGRLLVNLDDDTRDVSLLSSGRIDDGAWHFFATTADRNGYLYLYIDGGRRRADSSHIQPGRRISDLMRPLFLLLIALAPSTAHAYDLYNESSCSPGARWNTGDPVKVHLLTESFNDYELRNGIDGLDLQYWTDLGDMLQDIDAVIAEYNSISGIRLELEYSDPVLGDDDLGPFAGNDFDDQSVIIGFAVGGGGDNEAWGVHHPDDVCTYSEAHVVFKKSVNWVFGPPATTDVDGKYFGGGVSFRAVLLHEVGHAVGLAHPPSDYAVMNHGSKPWTRGFDEVPQAELLPDDINGLRALYSDGGPNNFDVSVTNTSFLPASDPSVDGDDAVSKQNCVVSSRGDTYADTADETVYCGVPGVNYPHVGNDVCPGAYIQLRYTVNNKSSQTLRLEERVWFSLDEDLEVSGPNADLVSIDVREWTIVPEESDRLGRMYRVPQNAPVGRYQIYVRVLPYSVITGALLWTSDEDQWNNSIRVRGSIDVVSTGCP